MPAALFNRREQPIFLYAGFLVYLVFIGQFFLIVAGRQDFDDDVGGAQTSFVIQLGRIADDADIGLMGLLSRPVISAKLLHILLFFDPCQ